MTKIRICFGRRRRGSVANEGFARSNCDFQSERKMTGGMQMRILQGMNIMEVRRGVQTFEQSSIAEKDEAFQRALLGERLKIGQLQC